ncbi:hypothetical protein [Streptomyces sp. S.PNR 29]|uniref:hypothetical protein n=1 Tax=Streptomyces sp. S.PNR 29 TaxID=2973805 RepID=UPI0025AF86AE|nr:hypothetical protein [Streptomyces sp. S.PNR 29]MDN0197646.1 hypothetical protein [Streptomyces sp. S.PNR 29]
MTGQQEPRKDPRKDRYTRARNDEEPGAHSGAESQAQERTIRGTASAKEGYQPERGTTAGKPLEGVEKKEARREPSPDEGEGEAGAG